MVIYDIGTLQLLMEKGQLEQYQAVSKLYQEIVENITNQELPQVKLFLLNLQKRIQSKAEPILSDYQSVKELLDNTKQAKGKVPLHFACAKGDVSIVQYLIQSIGVDPKIKDKEGNTPFFTALEHGHLGLIQYFIQQLNESANVTKQGEIAPIHIAANNNNVELIKFLVSKKADIEKISIHGKPINWAIGSGHLEATTALLELGANPNGDNSGSVVAPLILAIDQNRNDLYCLLITNGADINVKDPNGYSALHVAAEKGYLEVVKDLVVLRGADVNYQAEGKTALYLAFQHSQWQVVNFLKSKMPNFKQIELKCKEQLQKSKKGEVEPDPERAEEIKNIGNKFYIAKQYQQALLEYQKALSFDQENEVIHRNIAACYLAMKEYKSALFHCHEAKRHEPNNVKTSYRQAQAYIGLNNLMEAASSMWQCCMLEPANQNFRNQFQRLVEQAKKQYHQSKQ